MNRRDRVERRPQGHADHPQNTQPGKAKHANQGYAGNSEGRSAPTDTDPLTAATTRLHRGAKAVPIRPPVPPPAAPPTQTYLNRMARVDACPDACGNTEAPYRVDARGNGHYTAFYGCTDCGMFWHTGWTD